MCRLKSARFSGLTERECSNSAVRSSLSEPSKSSWISMLIIVSLAAYEIIYGTIISMPAKLVEARCEAFAEYLTSFENSELDGRHRQPGDVDDLLIGVPFVFAKDEHIAIDLGELRNL